MKRLAISILVTLLAFTTKLLAQETIYEGPWHTTNRKLDGTMTCVVTQMGDEKWQGRFYGVWQGVPFDYTVPFSGTASNLHGTATIDNADYKWTGAFEPGSPERFKGTFTGTRYEGYFDLKLKPPRKR